MCITRHMGCRVKGLVKIHHHQSTLAQGADRAKFSTCGYNFTLSVRISRFNSHLGVVWLHPCELKYCQLQLTLSLACSLPEFPIEKFQPIQRPPGLTGAKVSIRVPECAR